MLKPCNGLLAIALTFLLFIPVESECLEETDSDGPDMERLMADVYYLASDQLEGRLAGSPGAHMAAAYIEEQFASLGLVPADSVDGDYFQEFEITKSVSLGEFNHLAINVSGVVIEPVVEVDYTPLCLSSDGMVDGEVVFAGYGITAPEYGWDDYAEVDVEGKIAFCLRGEPGQDDEQSVFNGSQPTHYSNIGWKAFNALNHKATALILVTGPMNIPEGEEDELASLERAMPFNESGLPIVQISQEVAGVLWSNMGAPLAMYQSEMDRHMMPFGTLLEGVHVSLGVDLEREQVRTWNVAGILPGSDPALREEYVVVGAHYDHIGWGEILSKYEGEDRQIHNGADDNASGTSGVLELARMFVSSPKRPSRSILFICFTGEEMGLLGSGAYVRHPLVPLERTSAMLNMDMIGRAGSGEGGEMICIVNGVGSSDEWSEIVPERTPDGELELISTPDPIGGSDYVPFLLEEIPILFFITGIHDDYHRPTDDADRINYEGMASVIETVYEIAWEITERPDMMAFHRVEQPIMSGSDEGGPSFTVYLGTVPDFAHTEGGFWIADVREGSPAEEAGLMAGDRILGIDEYEVNDIYSYTYALGQFEPGDTAEITVIREGEELTLVVTFGAREED